MLMAISQTLPLTCWPNSSCIWKEGLKTLNVQIWCLSGATMTGTLSSRGFKARDVTVFLSMKLVKAIVSIHL